MSDDRVEHQHPAPQRRQVSLVGLWFGLFGAFAAWSTQAVVDYSIASFICFEGSIPSMQAPPASAWWTLIAVSGLAILISVAAVLVAYHSWRSSCHEAHANVYKDRSRELLEIGEGRTRFMAMAGLITSGLLLIVTLFNSLALFLTPLCRA